MAKPTFGGDTGLREECGVFGCVASSPWPPKIDVSNIIALGMLGLQHRGQESAGMVTSTGEDTHTMAVHKGLGHVNQIFTEERMAKMKGNIGIGHTRYSTIGATETQNCQPFVVETLHGLIATAHNGELVNANPLKQTILRRGTGLTTGSDSELMTQLLALSPPEGEPHGPDWKARIKQLMGYTLISYSMLLQYKDAIYAVRDPFGNRPLCIGTIKSVDSEKDSEKCDGGSNCEGWVVASESCCFQAAGVEYYREVVPGEIVKISPEGMQSLCIVPRPNKAKSSFCIFEYVYFARSDSIFEGQMVYTVRQKCGQQLAIEAKVDADIVSTVPESATPAALGFSKISGIPYVEVLCKNRYVGRTFIQPNTRLRQLGVAKKFGALTENFKDKKIVLVDDSIVRGNTMGPIVKLLKTSGAKEVHIRVASPPLKYPCYMGINIPTKDELIANTMSCDQLAQHLGADSVVYLSVEGLLKAVQSGIENREESNTGHCTACLTGKYPVKLEW